MLAVKQVNSKKLIVQGYLAVVIIIKDKDLIPMDIKPRVGSHFGALMVRCLSQISKMFKGLFYACFQWAG
jgi:hypothetical protein